MKRFNVTGLCVPHKHYMVDISGKLAKIKELIDTECYFTINRARQYGKTTTLSQLRRTLPDEYICASISFERFDEKQFESSEAFCKAFMKHIKMSLQKSNVPETYKNAWVDDSVTDFDLLSDHIAKMCRDRKVVLMVDEVDKTSNNRVFLHFLSMLRNKFLAREDGDDYTFHSVILAGVYDIKNIKLKMISEGSYKTVETENKVYNSPWNIAVDFEINMSFDAAEIATMLAEYEADHNTGMDIAGIAEEIYGYTSGYPFLVSRICKHIDEKLEQNWTAEGIQKAVKILLEEKNTLFDDIFKNIKNNKNLHDFLYELLLLGEEKPFNVDTSVIDLGYMYGFLKNADGRTKIANRIFEIRMTNYFISNDLENKKRITGVLQYDIVKNGRFDMELCLRKFAEHYAEIYNTVDAEFLERHGRLMFLSYLKPLINGHGFYHIESQFTDARRMDIVVDYGRDQFIIELKIWHGGKSHREGYSQLLGYMDSKRATVGYLVTFDFRQEGNKERKCEWVESEGKRIFDVIV